MLLPPQRPVVWQLKIEFWSVNTLVIGVYSVQTNQPLMADAAGEWGLGEITVSGVDVPTAISKNGGPELTFDIEFSPGALVTGAPLVIQGMNAKRRGLNGEWHLPLIGLLGPEAP